MVTADGIGLNPSVGRKPIWRMWSLQRHPALAALSVAGTVWLLLVGDPVLSIAAGLLLSCGIALLLVTGRLYDRQLAQAEDDARNTRTQLADTRSGLASALRRMAIIESDLPGLLFERRVCPKGNVTYPFFGGNLLSVLGLTPDQARNDPHRVLSCIHSDDRRRWDLLQRASEHACAGFADTFRIVGQSGEVFWAKCIANAQPDGAGGMLWTGLWIDVSAQQAAREAADRSSKAKGTLLATVSHELRTPLNAIIGFNDLLLEKLSSPDERRYAGLTRDAGAMLLRLVDQILVLSKAEHGRAAAREIPFSLSGLMSGSAALVAPMTQKNGLEITIATAPDVPDRLGGDPEKLRQVLVNLLSNAVKFSSNGTIAVWATRLDHQDREVRLRFAVTDTGCGIPADTLGDLFKPFAQASPQTGWEFGGTGLGLAICGELVQQMGGRIGATSRPGSGSTFWFEVSLSISADAEEIAPVAVAASDPAARAAEHDARPVRILVADDVALNRELLTTILEGEGHSVCQVCNGQEAVQAAAGGSFDLVFMDVQMPVMSGLDATRAIRDSDGAMSSVPIVAITADALDMSLERCRLAGMDAHLLKPLKKPDLLRAVSTWSRRPPPCAAPLGELADLDETLGNEALDGLASRLGRKRVLEFLDEFLGHLGRWHQEGDLDDLAKDVHRLLGSSGQLGFEALSRSCRLFLARYHDAAVSDLGASKLELRHAVDGALAQGNALLKKPLPLSLTTALAEPECVPC